MGTDFEEQCSAASCFLMANPNVQSWGLLRSHASLAHTFRQLVETAWSRAGGVQHWRAGTGQCYQGPGWWGWFRPECARLFPWAIVQSKWMELTVLNLGILPLVQTWFPGACGDKPPGAMQLGCLAVRGTRADCGRACLCVCVGLGAAPPSGSCGLGLPGLGCVAGPTGSAQGSVWAISFPSHFSAEAPLQGDSPVCLTAEIAHLTCKCLLFFLPNALLCIDSPWDRERDYQIV